jgi:hypothetical protein
MKGYLMQFISDRNPTASALYLVDRGMQGKHYRWFDADTNQWSQCGWHMEDALANRDKPSAIDFFPWCGPLTGKNFNPEMPIKMVTEEEPTKQPKTKVVKVKPAKKMAKQRTVAVVAPKTKQTKTVNQFPDGTVWFRADRQKWIAQWNSKQEAARPTAEACLKFLKKKYGVDGVVVE